MQCLRISRPTHPVQPSVKQVQNFRLSWSSSTKPHRLVLETYLLLRMFLQLTWQALDCHSLCRRPNHHLAVANFGEVVENRFKQDSFYKLLESRMSMSVSLLR